MRSPEEFRAEWGADDLVRYDPPSVEALSIPDSSKRFLVEVGLPHQIFASPRVRYRTYRNVPLLGKTFGDDFRLAREVANCRVLSVADYEHLGLSSQFLMFYCLDEQVDGRVLTVETDGNVRVWNTGVSQFAEFLLVIRQYDRWVGERCREREQYQRPFTFDEAEEMAEEIRRRMHWIDPDAFAVPIEEEYSAWEAYLRDTEMHIACSP